MKNIIKEVKNIEKNYSDDAIFYSKKHEYIYDLFDDILAKIELVSLLDLDGTSLSKTGLFLYVEDIKDHLKGLELQLKREIKEETLVT